MDMLELDAVGQAAAIRTGQVSARELQEAARQRLLDSDQLLHSVVWTRDPDDVDRDPGTDPEAPFAGVPIVVKDLSGWQRGLRMGWGVRALEEAGVVAEDDTPAGARLRAAGFVTLATTSTSPYGWGPWAATAAGHTRTPYDLDRASNGSSGGSAACVAVGAVAVGAGADAGGSIRLPADWCGVIGHKPSRGLVPSAWAHTEATEGALTRTVRDAAAVLDVLSAPEPGSLFAARRPDSGYAAALGRPLGRLRIAVLGDFADGTAESTRQVVAQVGERLADLGHRVEVATPPGLYDEDDDPQAGRALHAMLARSLAETAVLLGRPMEPGEIEPYIAILAEVGAAATAQDELLRLAQMQTWARRFLRFWKDHDVLVCPTSPFPPVPAERWSPHPEAPMEPWSRWGPGLTYTEPFNRSGQPATTVPAAVVDGLPHGVQLVGRWNEDALLLQLAGELEEQPVLPCWPLPSPPDRPSSDLS